LRVTAQVDFKTAIFDIDGTLIDSNGAHAETWAQALHEHGVHADVAAIRSGIGMGADKLLPAVANIAEDSELGRKVGQCKKALFAERLPALQPTPGARRLVEFLRASNVDLVIATSADETEMRELLKVASVDDLFPVRTTKDDVSESKPDPDVVHAAMARSHARPETTVMIGDTPYDVEAARRAHIRVFALRCGGHWSEADLRDATAVFDDPAALLEHLRQLS
jgi:HAD superfamily hydrolase (TIGR01509 family)